MVSQRKKQKAFAAGLIALVRFLEATMSVVRQRWRAQQSASSATTGRDGGGGGDGSGVEPRFPHRINAQRCAVGGKSLSLSHLHRSSAGSRGAAGGATDTKAVEAWSEWNQAVAMLLANVHALLHHTALLRMGSNPS